MTNLSIIIPAFNEGEGLEQAVKGLYFLLQENGMLEGCEFLIFNDFSSDNTGEVADNLAKELNNVRVIHNKKNMGLGYNFQEGARQARGEYVTWSPGDNENLPESIIKTLRMVGKADIVIPYTSNMEVRPLSRRILSNLYTKINNTIFGLNLKYYNGLSVYKRELLVSLPVITNSFAFAAEILVTLLKSGTSYVEVPIEIQPRLSGKSSALKLKNIIKVIKTISSLFLRINVRGGKKIVSEFKKSDFVKAFIAGEMMALLALPILLNLDFFNFEIFQKGKLVLPFLLFWLSFLPLVSVLGLHLAYRLAVAKWPVLFEVSKYGLIGLLNTVLTAGLLNILIILTGIVDGWEFDVFVAISFVTAVIHSFFWNKFWAFESKDTNKAKSEFKRFVAVSLVVTFIYTALMHLLVNVVGAPVNITAAAWVNISYLILVPVAFLGNFFGYKFFVFNNN
jgi:glycosyltransferase involved in cell wall biosynthesis/putative flippase GtrA